MKKNKSVEYPYITYDNDAKAISLQIREGVYFQSRIVRRIPLEGHMINVDYDKYDNILGLEILLPDNYNVPLKVKNSKGQTKKRSFQENVGDLKKQGYSEESARKITGKIYHNQEDSTKKKKNKK